MSIAELVEEYGNINDDGYNDAIKNNMRLAINEALELAAQEAENLRCSYAIAAHEAAAMAAKDEIAKRIRALMSPQEKSGA